MNEHEVSELYAKLGGTFRASLPVIESEVFQTEGGTPYLKAPGVALIACPRVDLESMRGFLGGFSKEFEGYLDDEGVVTPASRLCKVAGQLCYLSLGPGRTKNAEASKYFENILASGHGSVLEHAQFSFLLWGISRSQTHELVRHRAGCAYSQVSQRYVSGKLLRFVERPEYQGDDDLHRAFGQRIDHAARQYETIANALGERQVAGDSILSGEVKTERRKKVNQAARSVLPNETEAPIVFSANARALRHVISMRANADAEVEIRELFVRVFLVTRMIEPILFGDMGVVELPDGTRAVNAKHRKV